MIILLIFVISDEEKEVDAEAVPEVDVDAITTIPLADSNITPVVKSEDKKTSVPAVPSVPSVPSTNDTWDALTKNLSSSGSCFCFVFFFESLA